MKKLITVFLLIGLLFFLQTVLFNSETASANPTQNNQEVVQQNGNGHHGGILSGIKTRFNAITQMLIIATMNILEINLVPDLLLWGRANAIFAFLFILLVYYNEFRLNKNLALQA